MGRKPLAQFRVSEDLLEAVEKIATREDISKSAAWRDLTRTGIRQHDGEYEHIKNQQHLAQIKEEENTRQRRAWFRSNVGSQLLKCWNNGLKPQEANDATMGYRREATEIHEDDELVRYLEEGLEVYQESYPTNGARLSTWLKNRVSEDVDGIDNPQPQSRNQTKPVNTDVEPDTADTPEITVEEQAHELYEQGWDPQNVTHANTPELTDGAFLEVRERLTELYSEDSE